MFQQLKDKLSEKINSLKGPQDELDKVVCDLVDRATSDLLIGPDWATNMELVDLISQDSSLRAAHREGGSATPVSLAGEKTLKALKRQLAKPNAKIQLLTLTVLETCVKNLQLEFHFQLGQSELWLEMLRMAVDTSVTRVDVEVRDKILCMVEDYSRALQPEVFREAYETLLDRGVDFPVRAPDEQVPIITPPSHFTPAPRQQAPQQPVQPPAPAPAAQAVPEDVFAGMSEEDRLAVQAAMEEMEMEAQAQLAADRQAAAVLLAQVQASEGAAAARTLGSALGVHAGDASAGAAGAPAGGYQPPAMVPAGATVPLPVVPGVAMLPAAAAAPLPRAVREREERPALPADVDQALEVVQNSTVLLNEMLAGVPAEDPTQVRQPWVSELAEQCVQIRSALEDLISGQIQDETKLATALSQHEALSAVLTKYDDMLAKAAAVAPAAYYATAAYADAQGAAGHARSTSGAGRAAAPAVPSQAGEHSTTDELMAAVRERASSIKDSIKEKFATAKEKLFNASSANGAAAGTTSSSGAAAAAGFGASSPAHAQGVARVSAGGAVAVGAGAPSGGYAGVPTSTPPRIAPTAQYALDDEEDEDGEETALMTRRNAPGAVPVSPTAHRQPPAFATFAPQPAAPQPPAAPAITDDLISFDDSPATAAQEQAQPLLPPLDPVVPPSDPFGEVALLPAQPAAPVQEQQQAESAGNDHLADLLAQATLQEQQEAPAPSLAPAPAPAQEELPAPAPVPVPVPAQAQEEAPAAEPAPAAAAAAADPVGAQQ